MSIPLAVVVTTVFFAGQLEHNIKIAASIYCRTSANGTNYHSIGFCVVTVIVVLIKLLYYSAEVVFIFSYVLHVNIVKERFECFFVIHVFCLFFF